MSKEKNLVEDALIQMKNLEEAVAENAKGILASTMKQEIKELVKESIVSEDDDEEIIDEPVTGDNDDEDFEFPEDGDDEDSEFPEDGDDEDSDMSDLGMSDDDDDDRVIDLSGTDSKGNQLIPDEDLLKVFLSMKATDGIIVKKDNDMVNLKDDNTDKEYLIQMESDDMDEFMEESWEENESVEMDESWEENESMDVDDENTYSEYNEDEDLMGSKTIDDLISSVFDNESSYNKDDMGGMDDMGEGVVYELEMDEEDFSDDDGLTYEVDLDEMDGEEESFQMESMKPKIGKGAKIGKPKFSYKKTSGGFKDDKKQGTRGVGMGKGPKFEFKEGEMGGTKTMTKGGKPSPMLNFGNSKAETKEASRTYAFGSKDKSRGLRKGITPNRNLTFENEQKNVQQIQILREKNEEYRKALNVFRDKLNEVAVFNSNLAYATRLFTEHSTSKQEKINILRRFDGVESLKESKNLYRTIKSELTTTNKTSITESIEGKIEKTPSSGSASTLIESKTYENPQFLRMKDIMSKIIK